MSKNNVILCKNLAQETTVEELFELFTQAAPVLDIAYDESLDRSSCLIIFKNEEAAEEAADIIKGTFLHGRELVMVTKKCALASSSTPADHSGNHQNNFHNHRGNRNMFAGDRVIPTWNNSAPYIPHGRHLENYANHRSRDHYNDRVDYYNRSRDYGRYSGHSEWADYDRSREYEQGRNYSCHCNSHKRNSSDYEYADSRRLTQRENKKHKRYR